MIAFVARALERGCARIRERMAWRRLLSKPWGVTYVPPRHAMSQHAACSFAGIDRTTMPSMSWQYIARPLTLEDVREGMRRAFAPRRR